MRTIKELKAEIKRREKNGVTDLKIFSMGKLKQSQNILELIDETETIMIPKKMTNCPSFICNELKKIIKARIKG